MSIVRKEIETIDANKILTADDSGKVFMVGSSGNIIISLPAPTTAGLIFKFIAVVVTGTVTITSTAANIIGGVSAANPAVGESATLAASANRGVSDGKTSIKLTADATVGDTLELISNGTNYFLTGFCIGLNNSFSLP
jgi:hypothetical protein